MFCQDCCSLWLQKTANSSQLCLQVNSGHFQRKEMEMEERCRFTAVLTAVYIKTTHKIRTALNVCLADGNLMSS